MTQPQTPARAGNSPSNAAWQERNARLLAAYGRERSIDRRNAVVQANLPLVWQAARKESQRSGHSFEDLSQVGCLGLIKAVEAFDPGRGAALSSAAMPWIVGAMRQYLRDRAPLLRGSRGLSELLARGRVVQQQRLERGLPELTAAELATSLGCSPERWREALGLQHTLRLASLDQPQSQPSGEGSCLGELVCDPSSGNSYDAVIRSERRRLLRRALWRLERDQRRLLLGRVLLQRTWRELGAPLGLSGKVAQRRCMALLDGLREQLRPLLEGSEFGPGAAAA
jgi:RNA polymerase sigma-B factor